MRKRILSLFISIIFIATLCPIAMAADEDITVNVTVTDITDYTSPINILVERRQLSVTDFNLADYGDTMTGIIAIEGITYLHALIQLHRELYGDEAVEDNILLTTDGVTKIFMGRSVANVMYKNGKDIFALPQLVNIKDGDEIQVCLYDEGHSQAIATFEESLIDGVAVGENISLKLEQHYGFPRDRDPIEGAEITDEKGIYITDENGDIITTDEKGNFNVSFKEPGTYTVSTMPQINYYITDTGGGVKIEWVPVTKIETVEEEIYFEWTDAVNDLKAHTGCENVLIFDWDNMNNVNGSYETILVEKEVTTLEPVEVFTADELTPMVTYTTPLITINVTDNLIIYEAELSGTSLNISLKNSEFNTGQDLWVAGYDGNKMSEVKNVAVTKNYVSVPFDNQHETYKIMAWGNNSMMPICEAYTLEPQEVEDTSLDWDYTLPLPENIYITESEE